MIQSRADRDEPGREQETVAEVAETEGYKLAKDERRDVLGNSLLGDDQRFSWEMARNQR